MNIKDFKKRKKHDFTKGDKIKLDKLKKLSKEIASDMEGFKFHRAAEKLYHFFWHYYADRVIEELKPRLAEGDDAAMALLWEFHTTLIKLLHPFMPFITEKIWSLSGENKNLLMIEPWIS